ncbi:MAG TPA: RidA family protein [Dehalococcoidia bacterium]|jgi:enamine deaminase RidA (YjgF/YER057c/UK114 family)|nr:RidA family protein [Dehalococcoidia bacterium]
MGVADRLRELGIELPARRSYGKYAGAARSGDLVFVSGAGPIGPDGVVAGKVDTDVHVPAAQEAAKLCVINGLSALQEEIGDLDKVTRVVKLLGFVNSAPGFHQQHVVMDGASGLLLEIFGKKGMHARSSVGMAELPMNIAVEVEMIVEATR